jgi:hypothetical protein
MGRWKAFEESYNFGSDLISIGGGSQELCVSKVPRVQPGTVSGLLLGSPGDTLPSPGVNPLEGSLKCSYGKLGL